MRHARESTRRLACLGALFALVVAIPAMGGPSFEVMTMVVGNGLQGAAFSPDSATIATCDDSGLVKLWETSTGKLRLKLTGHQGTVRSVAFSPDGTTLASTGFDGTIRLYDPATGQPKQVFKDTAYTYFPSFSKSGKSLVTGSWENEPRIWSLETNKLRCKLTGHSQTAWAAAFSPSGVLVASGSRDNTVRLWDARTCEPLKTLTGHVAGVTAVIFSPDGSTITSAGADGSIRLWNVQTGTCKLTIYAHCGGTTDIAFSPDGGTLASTGGDGAVRLWDVGSGEMQRVLHEGGRCLAFSPNGKYLAAGTSSRLTLWDWSALKAVAGIRKGRADLRPSFTKWGLSPRFQADRGFCSVLVIADAIGYALAKRSGTGGQTSVEYLNWAANQVTGYRKDGAQFFEDLIKAYETYGICLEEYMPYQSKFNERLQPSEEARRNASENLAVGLRLHAIEGQVEGPRAPDGYISQVKAVIDSGYPVCAGSSHSILLVGYLDDPEQSGGGVFIARDSGTGCYTEPTYTFVRLHTGGFYWFE